MTNNFLMKFAGELKKREALPKNIEITQIGPVVMASIFNELRSQVITESIFTGMDVDPDLAVLKGLVEMTEREAFANGQKEGLPSCNTDRSDGFAAFPRGVVANTESEARKNAYCEAVERFAWASWWDDQSIAHTVEQIFLKKSKSPSERLLKELEDILPISAVYRITPAIAKSPVEVVIYFAFLEPFGVISGGAGGSTEQRESINFRAVSELIRHALAVRKIKVEGKAPVTFYERRLAHFGLTLDGSNAAKERIEIKGSVSIDLPRLIIDETVPHRLQDLVSVHRCYFEDQPPFVGGALERLCL